MAYAAETQVSVERTQAEIQQLIISKKATRYATGYDAGRAIIMFEVQSRAIRIELKLPDPQDKKFKRSPSGRQAYNLHQQRRAWEQACRSKWRSLLLILKAKFEALDSGISILDEEFLAWIVTSNNLTIGQQVIPEMKKSLEHKKAPKFLIGCD